MNIPEEKAGGVVKIPHVSHIQDKLKRLNAAITAGLKHDQEEKEREEAIRADWQDKEDFVEEEEEQIEEVEALFHEVLLEDPLEGSPDGGVEYRALPSNRHNVTVLPEIQTTAGTTTTQSTTATTSTTTKRTTTTTRQPSTTTTKRATSTTNPATSPMTRRTETKKAREWRKKKPSLLFEHPSSHFRPDNSSSGDLNDFIPMPKSNLPAKEDVFIVTPKYGMYTPVADAGVGDDRVGGANETIRKPNAGGTTSTVGKENKVVKIKSPATPPLLDLTFYEGDRRHHGNDGLRDRNNRGYSRHRSSCLVCSICCQEKGEEGSDGL